MQTKRLLSRVAAVLGLGVATAGFAMIRSRPLLIATGNELVEVGKYGPGIVRCIGGQPSGDPGVPCGPGTRRTLIRGLRSASQAVNTLGPAASFLAGENVMDNSCNFDADMRGRCWGTFEWTIPGKGGKWEGTWMGTFDVMASTASYAATAAGRGGDLDGRHLRYEAAMTGWSGEPGMSLPNPIVFIAQVIDR